ncbi:MAG: hypothetical protein LLG40_09385 [Deltaproteobacteria bacterium]|nr:hypothetical protein [Deltaproteobacteria bacterium]
MKNRMKIIMIIFSLTLILTTLPMLSRAAEASDQAPAEDKVTGEVAASVLSAYIWRGQELTRHSIVIQPSMTVGYKGFTANVWGNLDTDPYSAADGEYSSNFTETDVTLSYTHKFGIVSAGAGYIYYGLAAATPGGPDLMDSQEVFITMGLDTILAPTLTVYKEVDHYHQWYATLGISHTFALHEKVGLKLAAQASYLKSDDETTYPEFDSDSLATADKFNNLHDGMISASLPVSLTGHLTVTPTVTYVFPLSDDAKYEMKARGLQGSANLSEKDGSFLYGGVILSFTF